MPAHKKYPPELKERAVRMLLEWREARGRGDGGVIEVAGQLGVHPDTVRSPSTYYAAKVRPPCRRALRDQELKPEITRVFANNRHVYGPRKVWRALNREGIAISRCRTERLMRQLGLRGRSRARKRRTTIPSDTGHRARATSSTGTSRPPRLTSSGWPTSPTCRRGRGSPTRRS